MKSNCVVVADVLSTFRRALLITGHIHGEMGFVCVIPNLKENLVSHLLECGLKKGITSHGSYYDFIS